MWHLYIIDFRLYLLSACAAGLIAGYGVIKVVQALPAQMEREWAAHCKAHTGHDPLELPVPVTLGMGGRGLIVAMTAALFTLSAWRFGATPIAAGAMLLCAALVALAWIDLHAGLLPDIITLPLLWLGLLVNLHQGFTSLASGVLGAALGYTFLWAVFHVFRLVTGREGMGHGDFKLLAALAAWLGWGLLPGMLLTASVAGITGGIALRLAGRAAKGQPLPFGPYLALAGVLALLTQIVPPG